MTIDPSVAGRVYEPQPYEVGSEKIREFAEAIGDTNPVYRNPEAARALGHADVVAPPTFAMIPVLRGFDILMDDLGIEYSRVIHVDQRFVHNRPITAGDRLLTTTTLDTVRSRAGNDFLGIKCDVATSDGETVCTATATLLVRTEEAIGG
ncbi:MAG TPA: MaoC family dehydratase N-terminal domain-containing protein [Jiangellaceae bacterium]